MQLSRDGTTTFHTINPWLTVADIENGTGADHCTTTHTIRFARSHECRAYISINGVKVLDGCVGGCSASFIPAGTQVFIDADPSSGTVIEIGREALDQAANRLITPDNWFTATHPSLALIAQSLRLAILDETMAANTLLIDSMGIALVNSVVANLAPDMLLEPNAGLGRRKFAMVVDYIEANLSTHLGLDELAGVAIMSRFHFSREFRRSAGVSPLRYVTARRVQRTKQLLEGTETPLSHIALDCGFASQSHMTTTFKAATGHTPAAYRAAFKN